MDCREAQQLLLGADNVTALLAENAAVAAHARQCQECQRLIARLERLAGAAAHLPPGPPSAPPPAFLTKLAQLDAAAPAPLARILPAPVSAASSRRRWISRVLAAAIILVIGLTALTLCLNSSSARADTLLLHDLASWNLQLAQSSDPAKRSALYQQHAQEMKQRLASAALSAEDRAVAQAMLDTAARQAAEDNPLDLAARISQTADQVRALEAAAAPERRAALERLRQDLSQGARTHLQAVNPATLTPADQERFQKLQQHENPPASAAAPPRQSAQAAPPTAAWATAMTPQETSSPSGRNTAAAPHPSAFIGVSDSRIAPPVLPPASKPSIDSDGPPTPPVTSGHAAISAGGAPHGTTTAGKSMDGDDDDLPPKPPAAGTAFSKPATDQTPDPDDAMGAMRRIARTSTTPAHHTTGTSTTLTPATITKPSAPPPSQVIARDGPPDDDKPEASALPNLQSANPAATADALTAAGAPTVADMLASAGDSSAGYSPGAVNRPNAARQPYASASPDADGKPDVDAKSAGDGKPDAAGVAFDAGGPMAAPLPPLPGDVTQSSAGDRMAWCDAPSRDPFNDPFADAESSAKSALSAPSASPSPEPATALLLLLGAAALLRRRRHGA